MILKWLYKGQAQAYNKTMLEFLPPLYKMALSFLNYNLVYELRVRKDSPLMVNFAGSYRPLGITGLCEEKKNAIIAKKEEIENIVYAASNYSVYSVENQIRQGFITGNCGERIGLGGNVVYSNGQVSAIREIESLCIRVPHKIEGCAKEIYEKCFVKEIANTIILSLPGLGKTTILRDLAQTMIRKTEKNILVCDERGEIAEGVIGCDIIRFSDKHNAFSCGVRSLRPDILITDELAENDFKEAEKIIESGIILLTSCHFGKSGIEFPFRFFDYYISLDHTKIGKISEITNKKGEIIS